MADMIFQFDNGDPIQFDNGAVVEYGSKVLTSTPDDIAKRVASTLPPWFSDESPNLYIMLTGFSTVAAQITVMLQEAWAQERMATATGNFLDIAANDYFGVLLPRLPGEPDRAYSARTVAGIFRERVTVAALSYGVNAIMSAPGVTVNVYEYGLTDSVPVLTEYGAEITMEGGTTTIDTDQVLVTIPDAAYPLGLDFVDAAPRYGTVLQPMEGLVVINGLNTQPGTMQKEDGFDFLMEDGATTIDTEYMSTQEFQPLFDAIQRVKPIGTTVWVSIS